LQNADGRGDAGGEPRIRIEVPVAWVGSAQATAWFVDPKPVLPESENRTLVIKPVRSKTST